MRYVHADQLWVWGLFCFLGMFLNVNLATAIIPHGTDLQGLAAGAYQAEYLSKIWPGFWFLTLFNGFWILFKTQLGNTDILVRTITDAVWMSSKRAREWKMGIRAIYYGILLAFSVWGVFVIRSASPFQLFKILANMAGIVLLVAGHPDLPRQPPFPAQSRARATVARDRPARVLGVLRVLRLLRRARFVAVVVLAWQRASQAFHRENAEFADENQQDSAISGGILRRGAMDTRMTEIAPPAIHDPRKSDHVDSYHGTAVPDPYRWLEDDTSQETAAWVEAQNAVTFPYLERIPFRAELRARVLELNDYEKYSAPSRKGPWFFFSRNQGLQNQSVLYRTDGLDGTPEVLIDPNTWSVDGTVSLSVFVPSQGRAVRGLWHVAQRLGLAAVHASCELATKRTLDDTIEWVKVSGVAWHGDGFFYSRYPAPPPGQETRLDQRRSPGVLPPRRHAADRGPARLRGRRELAALSHAADNRGRTLRDSDNLGSREGCGRQRALRLRPVAAAHRNFRGSHCDSILSCRSSPTTRSSVIDNVGSRLLVQTNRQAPNWRVVRIDPARPDESDWVDVLPERQEPLQSAATAGGSCLPPT